MTFHYFFIFFIFMILKDIDETIKISNVFFILKSQESSHDPALVVKKNLDFDSGDHEFRLKIMASVRHSI